MPRSARGKAIPQLRVHFSSGYVFLILSTACFDKQKIVDSCAVVTEGQKSAVEEGTDLMGDTFPTKYNAYIDAQHSAAQFTYNVVRHQDSPTQLSEYPICVSQMSDLSFAN